MAGGRSQFMAGARAHCRARVGVVAGLATCRVRHRPSERARENLSKDVGVLRRRSTLEVGDLAPVRSRELGRRRVERKAAGRLTRRLVAKARREGSSRGVRVTC